MNATNIELGWSGLTALSLAFKTSDGTGPGLDGFKQLLTIAADPLDPPDAARARAILEERHGVTVTLPAGEACADETAQWGPGSEGYAAWRRERRRWEIAGRLGANVVAVDFRGDDFAAGWTPDDPDRAA